MQRRSSASLSVKFFLPCFTVQTQALFDLQAKALFDAPPGAPHLLPFYSRVAASLAQVFPDVASALLRYLEEEFALLQVGQSRLYFNLSCSSSPAVQPLIM